MLNICRLSRWYNIATIKVYRVYGQSVSLVFFSFSSSCSEYTAYIAFKIHHPEFGISVHCTLISLNTNYTSWRINWQSLLQILLAGSHLPPHTGFLLFTIGLPTLPFPMTREVQDKASFCLELICRSCELWLQLTPLCQKTK
jgi:hypothetical protein